MQQNNHILTYKRGGVHMKDRLFQIDAENLALAEIGLVQRHMVYTQHYQFKNIFALNHYHHHSVLAGYQFQSSLILMKPVFI